MPKSNTGCRRCSLCGINFPTNLMRCGVCGGTTDYIPNDSPQRDWRDAVALARGEEETPKGEVRFIYETGPDGVERIHLDMAELVRARLASSVLSLRLLAQTNPDSCPDGLPVLKVNGLYVELQGYDESRRRWWVELLDAPVVEVGEAVSF